MRNIQNILLTEKYRPQSLEDLITPKRVGDKLSKGVYQHLLLHGSPGKTSFLLLVRVPFSLAETLIPLVLVSASGRPKLIC